VINLTNSYSANGLYDEMLSEKKECRSHYSTFNKMLESISSEKLLEYQQATDRAQVSMGMTFNVYHENKGIEKILPLDIIPRIISGKEWSIVEEGLKQRIHALNLFIHDIYNKQKILKDKVVPEDLLYSSGNFLKPLVGLTPPKSIWCHISGSDLIRDEKGDFYVLEDNLRVPSGVSYLLENREILKRVFPNTFNNLHVRPVSDYPNKLLRMLQHLSGKENPVVGLLSPGIYNSAYFEHSYLALLMGIELIVGQDLVVNNDKVYMKTTKGLHQVDVIYRRVDDTFLDPLAFNPKSMLGAKGLFDAYKKGNLALANAPGTGVADDKAIYAYVPRIIKYYLDEEPIISNVKTYICAEKSDRDYVLENIEDLVVKETNAAGGYGMMIGPKSTKEEHAKFRELVKKNPRTYIAQPTLSLSTVPTLVGNEIEPRHVDLRPFILYGEDIEVLPGALTRVALKKGSLVVNSSQGGGSKDTWVLND
tara:strand:+ start:20629 stop:22062 length:1434 start_codon:yes stop_codon:yes gene_type:complete